MTARALTEEEPRTAAEIAADALDVCEKVGGIVTRPRFSDAAADAPASILGRDAEDLRWQVQRLARQVAELAQLVDDPAELLPDERADAEAEQRAIDAEDTATHRRQTIRIIEQDDGQPVVIYGNRRAWTIEPGWGAGSNPDKLIADLWFYGPDRMPEHWTEIPLVP